MTKLFLFRQNTRTYAGIALIKKFCVVIQYCSPFYFIIIVLYCQQKRTPEIQVSLRLYSNVVLSKFINPLPT
nr:MAG TPA: hypothetical protein [Caudoviricetes sp.]